MAERNVICCARSSRGALVTFKPCPVVARNSSGLLPVDGVLIGRTLSNAMLSLGIYEDVQGALEAMGLNLEELIDEENDPGLGNGGWDVWQLASLILWRR